MTRELGDSALPVLVAQKTVRLRHDVLEVGRDVAVGRESERALAQKRCEGARGRGSKSPCADRANVPVAFVVRCYVGESLGEGDGEEDRDGEKD